MKKQYSLMSDEAVVAVITGLLHRLELSSINFSADNALDKQHTASDIRGG